MDDTTDNRKPLLFKFSGYSGWDSLKSLFPERWQASWVGRALQDTIYKGLDYTTTVLIVRMPNQTYEIDQTGTARATRFAVTVPIP